jgi:phospholipid/cholesterol/gamma-HCH transport system substrate-binding protein
MSVVNVSKRLAVGGFITIGVAILIAAVFVVGGQHKAFVKSIHVHILFDNVQGLQTGNNIWLSGIKVGTVKTIAFSGNSQVAVTLSIDKQAQPHIRKDSKCRISTDGLFGNKIIVIDGGSDTSPVIENNDSLRSERLAGTEELMSTLEKSNNNLLEITGNIKTISKRLTESQGTLGQLINDPAIADRLKGSLDNLRNATAGSEAMIANLRAFSQQLRQPGGLANTLVTDTTVFSHLRGAVNRLDDAAARVQAFSNSLQTAGAGLNDKNAPIGMLLHDENAADNLQRTLKNLRVSSQELSDDLEAIQHSWLLRGFFKKKDK